MKVAWCWDGEKRLRGGWRVASAMQGDGLHTNERAMKGTASH